MVVCYDLSCFRSVGSLAALNSAVCTVLYPRLIRLGPAVIQHDVVDTLVA